MRERGREREREGEGEREGEVEYVHVSSSLSLDTVTRDLFIKYKEMSNQYQTVMNNMEAMNSSITQLLLLMDAMNIGFTQKLAYLNETLGGTQGTLHIVTSIISHLSFFLFSILVSLFLEVPFKPKFCLFILVTGSLVTDIMFGKGLSFLGLTGTLATILIGMGTLTCVYYVCINICFSLSLFLLSFFRLLWIPNFTKIALDSKTTPLVSTTPLTQPLPSFSSSPS